MKKLIVLGAIIVSILTFSNKTQAHYSPGLHNIRHAINLNWCGKINKYCEVGRQAWVVVGCETGYKYNIWAGYPGTYWGLFQMDSNARRTYGHGWSSWKQTKAAHKYWKIAGWEPWPYCGRNYY